jgi:hypothetical protein
VVNVIFVVLTCRDKALEFAGEVPTLPISVKAVDAVYYYSDDLGFARNSSCTAFLWTLLTGAAMQ